MDYSNIPWIGLIKLQFLNVYCAITYQKWGFTDWQNRFFFSLNFFHKQACYVKLVLKVSSIDIWKTQIYCNIYVIVTNTGSHSNFQVFSILFISVNYFY